MRQYELDIKARDFVTALKMTELFSLTPGSGDPVKEVRHLGVDTWQIKQYIYMKLGISN
jgi:hypothetical protein